jgi:hypothetical protein
MKKTGLLLLVWLPVFPLAFRNPHRKRREMIDVKAGDFSGIVREWA